MVLGRWTPAVSGRKRAAVEPISPTMASRMNGKGSQSVDYKKKLSQNFDYLEVMQDSIAY